MTKICKNCFFKIYFYPFKKVGPNLRPLSSSIWIRFLRVPPFRSSVPTPRHFFSHFSFPLGMLIDSEIMDGFWHSRCLNNHIDLFYMIGSFASGTNVSLVAKNGTKKIIPLLWIKSSKKPQIKKFDKTDPPKRGNSDSKYNFKIFKNQKSNSKKTP